MVRSEFVVAGCIFVVLAFAVLFIGYENLQATPMEKVVGFVEQVTGRPAPESLHPPKTTGIILLLFGGALLITGVSLILKSRADSSRTETTDGGR